MVPLESVQHFRDQGYVIARGLFSPADVKALLDHYMQIHAEGGRGFAEGGIDMESADPLRRYPRLMHPHRGDQVSLEYLLDKRINEWLTAITGGEPLAVQTMVYFKPPGARGQALHQDQRYLHVDPGTCVAAWLALDRCDEANGCLQIVPGSQELPVLCLTQADTTTSFTWDTVPVPPGLEPMMLPMEPGDMLFFNGSLIHGSPANTSDRFRRIIVGHYLVPEAEKVALGYHPVMRMDGTVIDFGVNEGGGECGTFHMLDGRTIIEMDGHLSDAVALH